MPMRLSGLMSGMDTESIVSQLVEAKKAKVTKAVKAQKTLKYKQDAWKTLNTQIRKLYDGALSNLRFESAYKKKTTKVSNSSIVSVITGENAMNGVQSLKVEQLAKTGFLTGGELKSTVKDENNNIVKVSGSTTLGELEGISLGENETGSLTVEADGKKTTITVGKDTTLNSFVSTLRNVGLNVNFDETNQRIYISSKSSGAKNDFSIYANDIKGLEALSGLGLDYDDTVTDEDGNKSSAFIAHYQSIIDNQAQTLSNRLEKQLSSLISNRTSLHSRLGNMLQSLDSDTLSAIKGKLTDAAFTQTVTVKDDDGNDVTKTLTVGDEGFDYTKLSDEDWAKLNTAVTDATKAWNITEVDLELSEAKKALEQTDPTDTDAYEAAQQKVADAEAKKKTAVEAYEKGEAWAASWKSLEEVNSKLTADRTALTDEEKQRITDEVDAEVKAATEVRDALQAADRTYSAQKTVGQDAKIYLNGVEYNSDKNTFAINGLTLTVSGTTAPNEEVTITTEDDITGVYDMIKNFIKEYNTLINQMDKLYNAESARGYEPLTDEEKESMSDSQIEEWEEKITDSILRKDSSLNSIFSAMKRIMSEGVEVNGKMMYLSSFGINTQNYFSAPEFEKNAYHIDGDSDDSVSSGNADVLKSMIASDPDTVISFFTQLSNNMREEMFELMKGTEYSSVLTAYDDKKMQTEYDDYTTKIKELEKKLADYEDKWYAKFAAMETALAKMQNNASAVTSLLGG